MEIVECKSAALFDEEGGLSEPEEASQRPAGPSFCPICEKSLQVLPSRDRRDHVTSCLATRLAERKQVKKSERCTQGLTFSKPKINVFSLLKANQKNSKKRKQAKRDTKKEVKTILDFFADDEYFERKETRDKWSNLLYGKKKDRTNKNSLVFGKRKREELKYRIPDFKRIVGTNIYVDAFTYQMPRNSIFFLTHFHSDHYRGLTRNFTQGPIYCSTITANLARQQFRIGSQLRELPLGKRMPVPGARPRTYVTLLDANHCAGAVMFLFEVYPGLKPFPDDQTAWQSRPEVRRKRKRKGIALFFKPTEKANGAVAKHAELKKNLEPLPTEVHDAAEAGRNKEISLHVGDFRALPEEMAGENGSVTRCLKGHRVQNLYLDTTYCGPQYVFPSQQEVLGYVEKYIKEILSKRGCSVLIYIGTYSIGKEKVLVRVSRASKRKIWVDRGKMKKLELLGLGDDLERCFTTSYASTQIRAAPLWALGVKFLKDILGRESDRFQTVVGIKPTGWSGKVKRRTHGAVQILSVPYSEHSNFLELKEFTQKLKPEVIIPTVNCGSQSQINRQVNMLKS